MRMRQASNTGLPTLDGDTVEDTIAYRVTASAAGESWTMAEGVGGGRLYVSDPAAPLDVATTYTITLGDGTGASFEFTRRLADPQADTVLASTDGRAAAEVLWDGDAGSSLSPRASYSHPLAYRWPHQVVQLSPGAPTWAFAARVEADRVAALRAVLESGRLWVVHSHVRCSPACGLPLVMLCGVAGDVAEKSWQLGRSVDVKLQQLERVPSGVAPVTWGDLAGAVWGPGTTFNSLRLKVTGG